MNRTRIAALAGVIVLGGVTVDGAKAGCGNSSMRDVRKAATSHEAGGATAMRAAMREKTWRLPSIKLLKVLDDTHVYMRTDNALLERLGADGGIIQDRFFINGATAQTEQDPDARSPDEITLSVRDACLIEGKTEFHKYELVDVRKGSALIRHSGRTSRNLVIDETITVAPYADAAWTRDPQDATRITYREWDATRHLRTEKHYRNNRLDGRWTQWYGNGRKQFKTHWLNDERHGLWTEWYPTGEKRYEAAYRNGRIVGTEYWWRRDNTVMAIGEHPEGADEIR